MRYKKLLLFISLAIYFSCKKHSSANKIPACIDSLVNNFKTRPFCDSGASVKEYNFQNKIVFTFDPGNCGADLAGTVYDSDCNYLGLLGGFAGNTEINGAPFSSATYIRTIWQK